MFGGEVLVGYLIAWGVRKARRAGQAADAEADRVLDALLERLHETVSDLIGADPSLSKLDAEVAGDGQVRNRTRAQASLALDDALEQHPEAAYPLIRLLEQLRQAEADTGIQLNTAESSGIAITGTVNLNAAQGGVTAFQIGTVTRADKDYCECGREADAACTKCGRPVCAGHAARLDGRIVCLDDYHSVSHEREHEVEIAWQELLRVLAVIHSRGISNPPDKMATHAVRALGSDTYGQSEHGDIPRRQLRGLVVGDPCPIHEEKTCTVRRRIRRGAFGPVVSADCEMALWAVVGDDPKQIYVNRTGQLITFVASQLIVITNMRPVIFQSTMTSPGSLVDLISSATRRLNAIAS